MLFNPVHAAVAAEAARGEYAALERRVRAAFDARRQAAAGLPAAQAPASAAFVAGRSDAAVREGEPGGRETRARSTLVQGRHRRQPPTPDVNYVFPTFVTTQLPIGLVGLIIAAIFAAAMSSIAAELNSLATATRDRHLPAAPVSPRPPTRTI